MEKYEEYLERGNELFDDGDLSDALHYYNYAIALNPESKTAFSRRANCKSKLEDFEGAIIDLSRVIELDPQDIIPIIFRAEAKNLLMDYQGAQEDLTLAIKVSPDMSGLYFQRYRSKMKLKDFEGALMDLSLFYELDHDFMQFDPQLADGEAKSLIEDYSRAMKDFAITALIKLNPN